MAGTRLGTHVVATVRVAEHGAAHVVAEEVLKEAARGTAETVGGQAAMWTLPAASLVTAAFSQWDHLKEKGHITEQYKPEIGALLGKSAEHVKTHDMERVARENPAIAEAVHRSRLKRNLSIAATVVATGAAFALAGAFAPAIGAAAALVPGASGAIIGALASAASAVGFSATGLGSVTGMGGFLTTSIAGSLTFLGVEKAIDFTGRKALKLDEPSLAKVERNPALQSRLSVHGQINFLAHQQELRRPITRAQIMTVVIAANPAMDEAIKAHFGGRSFEGLNTADKAAVLDQLGAQFDLGGLTKAVNTGHMRVQELAFTAYGQTSGVARYEGGEAGRAAQRQRMEALETQPDMNPDARSDNAARLRRRQEAERAASSQALNA